MKENDLINTQRLTKQSLNKHWLVLGALLAGTAVILGAFAAHGLSTILTASQLTTFETAVRYQMYHGLALLLLPTLSDYVAPKWLKRVAVSFCCGCLLFSASLYLLVLTGAKWFGPITPLGGVLFIVGWALLTIGLLKGRSHD
ncbi:DUF423 domain-containing protein [Alteromonas sp. 345S023]|uniref:DUF423 domain-containing protein n=1 Tax=Alteromonas profundi TaxID=2696062 RepID=A0A7X5RKN1_9ALTE|nr:DUF423 domain-containing protein [Alteromonas profundi]NDV91052.1 DUF423 domain-containing protein [Alteromonas profundi]